MKIISPEKQHIPALRFLWKEVFGDTEDFLDNFFYTAFSPRRCFCIFSENKAIAALYWFDCEYKGKTVAYLYAIATAEEYRGQGLCHELMSHTHAYLENHGYTGTILVPGEPSLFRFYRGMGYETCCQRKKIKCTAPYADTVPSGFSLTTITKEVFASLRRDFLPENGIIQEGVNIDFLETHCSFYAGADYLLTVEGHGIDATFDKYTCPSSPLLGLELLGNVAAAPQILQALGYTEGVFHVPGDVDFTSGFDSAGSFDSAGDFDFADDFPLHRNFFAMYKPLGGNNITKPEYLGFAFD